MGYGQQKYPSTELRRQLLEAIDRRLQLMDCFGPSQAYYGLECSFSLSLVLHGRQTDMPINMKIAAHAAVGDQAPPQDPAIKDLPAVTDNVTVGAPRTPPDKNSNIAHTLTPGPGVGESSSVLPESIEQREIQKMLSRRKALAMPGEVDVATSAGRHK